MYGEMIYIVSEEILEKIKMNTEIENLDKTAFGKSSKTALLRKGKQTSKIINHNKVIPPFDIHDQNCKLKDTLPKHNPSQLNTSLKMLLIILSLCFFIFFVVAVLIAIFQPILLDRIAEYSADFIKVTIGAVLGWLLHRGRG